MKYNNIDYAAKNVQQVFQDEYDPYTPPPPPDFSNPPAETGSDWWNILPGTIDSIGGILNGVFGNTNQQYPQGTQQNQPNNTLTYGLIGIALIVVFAIIMKK